MNELYGNDFHENRHQNTYYAANKILSIIVESLPKIESSVDIGCGVGTWLYAIKELGAKNILGIDGPWVDKELLMIPSENFETKDLVSRFRLDIKYDVCISLEVAEHLPSSNAADFVSTLTSLSDFIIFSAAHPHQGGVGHINEQWSNYWIDLFEKEGYIALDIVRRKIFTDNKISKAYRKNILLYVKKERVSELKLNCEVESYTPPEKYLLYFKIITKPGIKQSFNSLIDAVKNRLKNQ